MPSALQTVESRNDRTMPGEGAMGSDHRWGSRASVADRSLVSDVPDTLGFDAVFTREPCGRGFPAARIGLDGGHHARNSGAEPRHRHARTAVRLRPAQGRPPEGRELPPHGPAPGPVLRWSNQRVLRLGRVHPRAVRRGGRARLRRDARARLDLSPSGGRADDPQRPDVRAVEDPVDPRQPRAPPLEQRRPSTPDSPTSPRARSRSSRASASPPATSSAASATPATRRALTSTSS